MDLLKKFREYNTKKRESVIFKPKEGKTSYRVEIGLDNAFG